MTSPVASPVVLLVEDEMFVRMTMYDMLEDAGCSVLEAGDAAGALALLRQAGRIDLLVSDVGLPDMDGVELFAACSAMCPGLPVIFITGYGHEHVLAHVEGQPRVRVLGKPFQQRALFQTVEELLALAQQTPAT